MRSAVGGVIPAGLVPGRVNQPETKGVELVTPTPADGAAFVDVESLTWEKTLLLEKNRSTNRACATVVFFIVSPLRAVCSQI